MESKFIKNYIENEYITEKELKEIFLTQYNDIFHHILKYDKNKMMILLQEQVNLNLKLINKFSDLSLIQHIFSIFVERYSQDKKKVSYIYRIIKNNPSQITYLNYLNCFIHCIKCKNALHKCGNNFIVYNDYVFCLSCMEVYNEFQVDMYCKECKVEYYTKLREIKNKNEAYLFPVSYEKYHCQILDFDEKIKCNKCKSDLYLDINTNKIKEIFCKKCKIIYDINKINNICFNCKFNFKSKIKIHNYFPSMKIDLLTIIHTLFNHKFAFSLIIKNKECECDLSDIQKIKHYDEGDLLEGDRLGRKVIICNKCFDIISLDNIRWICPKCKKAFGTKKRHIYEYKLKDHESLINKNNYHMESPFKNKNKNNFYYNSPISSNHSKNIITRENNLNYYSSNISINKTKRRISNSKIYSSNNSIKKINRKISHPKDYSINNSIQKANSRIFNYNKYSIFMNNSNYKTISKLSKSVGFLKENNILTNNSKIIEYKTRNYINNINNIRDNKNHKKEHYNTDIDSNNSINFLSKINTPNNGLRNNINFKIIEVKDNTENKNKIYNSNIEKIKKKEKKQINNIKKKLLYDLNENNESKLVKKNLSITSSLIMKKKNSFNDNIILTTKNIFKKDKDKNKIVKNNQNNNINKNNASLNDKNINKINKINIINSIKKINLENINKIKNINSNKKNGEKKNNHIKNISINININNSDNSIYQVNKRIEEISINKNKDEIKKKNNLENHIQNNLQNSNKRKNHIHFISQSNYNSTEKSGKRFNSKRNLNIHIPCITANLNETNNNLNQRKNSNNFKHKPLITSDIILHKKKSLIKSSKNNKIAKKEFHSDDYNIIDLLGEGTFGKIYLVKKNNSDEVYALKQISAKNRMDSNKYRKQFELLMKLTEKNPNLNIIKILGIEVKQLDKFSTVLYILMEAGKSDWEKELYKRNREQRYYSENELMEILISLVSTFSYLQEKGISHRDVKPQNILFFQKKGEKDKDLYKITDFGEAKIKNVKNLLIKNNFEKNTSKQTVRGTELYMSPLLFNALRNTGEIDIQYNPYKSDVYSLGLCILLAACLSYIPLYQIREIDSMEKVKNSIESFLNRLYSKKFINLILVMLQINEKFRPDFIELNSWIKNHYFNQ